MLVFFFLVLVHDRLRVKDSGNDNLLLLLFISLSFSNCFPDDPDDPDDPDISFLFTLSYDFSSLLSELFEDFMEYFDVFDNDLFKSEGGLGGRSARLLCLLFLLLELF